MVAWVIVLAVEIDEGMVDLRRGGGGGPLFDDGLYDGLNAGWGLGFDSPMPGI